MGMPYSPLVAFDGTHYLAVWPEYYGVSGRRIATSGQIIDTNLIAVERSGSYPMIALSYDGNRYLVSWTSRDDIYGSQVTPFGGVSDSFPMVVQSDLQTSPALVAGGQNRVLLAFSGWAGIEGGREYNSMRIWGKLGPFGGVQETPSVEVRRTNQLPTIVRGVLELEVGSRQPTAYRADLLDFSERKVLGLHLGANDVSRLSPGVYFVRLVDENRPSVVQKIVVIK